MAINRQLYSVDGIGYLTYCDLAWCASDPRPSKPLPCEGRGPSILSLRRRKNNSGYRSNRLGLVARHQAIHREVRPCRFLQLPPTEFNGLVRNLNSFRNHFTRREDSSSRDSNARRTWPYPRYRQKGRPNWANYALSGKATGCGILEDFKGYRFRSERLPKTVFKPYPKRYPIL